MENKGEIVIYKGVDGKSQLDVRLSEETIWLTQKQMSELFDRDYKTISKHINNIYKETELLRKATVAKYATVQIEANRKISRALEYYSLDMIISVGYRVNSKRGTQFCI